MFMSITKQVLCKKKETKEQQAHDFKRDNIKISKNHSKGVKRKCC